WLVPALPLAGFLALVIGARLPRRAAAVIGVASVGAAMIVALAITVRFMAAPPPSGAFTQVLWQWMRVSDFEPRVALYLDALAGVMMAVVTAVSFLIHLYSARFMKGDEGHNRFFAYMNLFVASMLILVLADNLLLLYLGWEGVGLCSYLLIWFWYKDPANARAAVKAFVVTRVGDAAMAVGLLLLFVGLGTLEIQPLMEKAADRWPAGSALAVAAAALLLGGAVGKSAQLPLQTWLPDAMAGPTPTSALIHAATMVTAGVYLIARTHVIFELAPPVQTLVAIVGAVTLLVAGCSALVQWDIKRVLAYSTISQVGYMFLALGVGAWSAGIFYFMTHALFKSLLFLGAGVVILAMDGEHDMFKMGGLRKAMPLVFWTFLVGACSLAALPFATAGFYSKDMILAAAWASQEGGPWLWAAGLAGAFVTSVYTFRMVFLTFFGPMKAPPTPVGPGLAMGLPLVVLAVFSIAAGFVQMPEGMGDVQLFTGFLKSALPAAPIEPGGAGVALPLGLAAAAATLLGILAAWWLFLARPSIIEGAVRTPAGAALHKFWFAGWGFDGLYDRVFVRPLVWLARVNRADFVDSFYRAVAAASERLHRVLRLTQTGRVRWYAAGVTLGAIVVIAIMVFV
ncbi:MAG: NADH-quinone oxidoreductase subunit L, partial [Planctomycetota bacterium]|nr:NADH-quinone oxidoreductase subunit L [Planctomycetota bacterium]